MLSDSCAFQLDGRETVIGEHRPNKRPCLTEERELASETFKASLIPI